mmetsp:Transcript_4402/g.6605  ORF Transcript_4402/g.6605 Transcript_4402/m.6605 type:complete len:80 (+) Transcript_4402:1236-1475(+)
MVQICPKIFHLHILSFFLQDDVQLAQIASDYSSGKMLTGQVKAILIDILIDLTKKHQQARALVTSQHIESFTSIRHIHS